jgi:hypothetical protein
VAVDWLAYATHFPLVSQHPLPQDVGSHPQTPDVPHDCPAAQATHAAPPLPQAAFVGVVQCPVASQQPEAHEVALQVHTPCSHACPVAHAVQSAPPLPHAASVGAVTQLPLSSQQPPGHDAGSHWPPASPAPLPPPSGAAPCPPMPVLVLVLVLLVLVPAPAPAPVEPPDGVF